MGTSCKNCNQIYTGNFCPNCGQTADTHEINLHFLWHDIQHGLFHFDNGIFFTIKELLTRPGYTIREFIEGKRVKHFKPISFLIVIATIYGLLMHYFGLSEFEKVKMSQKISELTLIMQVYEWLRTHYAFANLALLPFISLGTYWAFRKEKYNYIQHLILNAFLSGLAILLRIFCFPFFFFFEKEVNLQLLNYMDLIGIGYKVWALFQFFNYLPVKKRIWKTILSYIYLGILFLLIVLLIAFIVIYLINKSEKGV